MERVWCIDGESRWPTLIQIALFALGMLTAPVALSAQDADAEPTTSATPPTTAPTQKIDVAPVSSDAEIADRLQSILEATGWFSASRVKVKDGVVFLNGSTAQAESREWATQLAGNTEDVVAVVNHIQVNERSLWDFSPAWRELQQMGRDAVQISPLLGVALLLLIASWYAAKATVWVAGWMLETRMSNALLRQVLANSVAIPVFLAGLYLILRISGLTQIAVTVLGGTGIIGLVIGIAFRDIAENFLASILISMQRPFTIGDLIEVAGEQGLVQSVTTRGTLLMRLDGNHVQIPNATIYKAVIRNATANPKLRQDFVIGIGYDDPIGRAQEVGVQILRVHPAVLDDPEPWVLVDELGAATINLRIYFWIDGQQHNGLKVRSSVIRQLKRAFDEAGISMPDEAREVIFPQGVPLIRTGDESGSSLDAGSDDGRLARPVPTPDPADDRAATSAEGGLSSDLAEIQKQARESRRPDEGTNLLEPDE